MVYPLIEGPPLIGAVTGPITSSIRAKRFSRLIGGYTAELFGDLYVHSYSCCCCCCFCMLLFLSFSPFSSFFPFFLSPFYLFISFFIWIGVTFCWLRCTMGHSCSSYDVMMCQYFVMRCTLYFVYYFPLKYSSTTPDYFGACPVTKGYLFRDQ